MEVAEDDPAVLLDRLLLDEVLEGDKLGAVPLPIRADIVFGLPLASVDVDLRMY